MINSRLLKASRAKNGLTQVKVSKCLGLSPKQYCNKENGKAIFDANEILRLSKELNLTMEERDAIFFGDELTECINI